MAEIYSEYPCSEAQRYGENYVYPEVEAEAYTSYENTVRKERRIKKVKRSKRGQRRDIVHRKVPTDEMIFNLIREIRMDVTLVQFMENLDVSGGERKSGRKRYRDGELDSGEIEDKESSTSKRHREN